MNTTRTNEVRSVSAEQFHRSLRGRRLLGNVAVVVFLGSTFIGLATLAALIIDVLIDGLPWLDWDFLSTYPSRRPEDAGIRSALFGTLWIGGLTALFTFPIGTATAIYLEEYAPRNRLTQLIEVNISNQAGVPSIVYGLLGLAVFVFLLGMGRVIIAGALTLTLLVLPLLIVAGREAIRAVPDSYRQGSLALGATRWQTVRHVILPSALPGYSDGDDSCDVARDWGGCAAARHIGPGVCDVYAGAPVRAIHRACPFRYSIGCHARRRIGST